MLKRILPVVSALVISLALAACGDSTATPAPAATTVANAPAATTAAATTAAATTAAATTAASATTAAATTAAAGATTAAAGSSTSLADIPTYPGASVITLPDTIKNQFMTSVGSSVKNPQVGAFTTADDGTKIKAYYTDYFTKNGWKDLSASLGAATSQLDQLGGFYLIYSKDKSVFVVLGLPGSAAAGLGATGVSVPATGSLVLGFAGDAA